MHHEKTSHDGRPRRATPLQKLPAVGRMPSSSPLWRPQLLEFLRRRKKMKKVLSWRITKTLNTSTYLNYLTDVHRFTGFSSGWILDWSVSQSHKWETASWNFTCSSAKITSSWKVLSCYEMLWANISVVGIVRSPAPSTSMATFCGTASLRCSWFQIDAQDAQNAQAILD